jgi:hypothetical protein
VQLRPPYRQARARMGKQKGAGWNGKEAGDAYRRLVDGIRRLMPGYLFSLSYLGNNRRSVAETIDRTTSHSTGNPASARSRITE